MRLRKSSYGSDHSDNQGPTPLQLSSVLVGIATLLVLGPACGYNEGVYRPPPLPPPPDIPSVIFDRSQKPHDFVPIPFLREVRGLAFSAKGHRIAYGVGYGNVRIWDFDKKSGEEYAGESSASGITGIAFSHDDKWLAASHVDGTINVWDARILGKARVLGVVSGGINCLAFSPDSRWLAAAGGDHVIRIWSLSSGLPFTLTGHTKSINSVAFSPDGKVLASAGSDATVRLWDLANGKQTSSQEHFRSVLSVAFSPDGARLASSEPSGMVSVADVQSGKTIFRSNDPKQGEILHVDFAVDGQTVVAASSAGVILFFDTTNQRPTRGISAHNGPVLAMDISSDGKFIATASTDQIIRLWKY